MTLPRISRALIILSTVVTSACVPISVPGSGSSSSSSASKPSTPASSIFHPSVHSLSSSPSSPPSSSFSKSVIRPSTEFVPSEAEGLRAGNQEPATLTVPFTPQAPFANWDTLHEEACEEAAILMVVHFLNGTPLNPEIAELEIQDLVAWEYGNGYGHDVSASQMADIARTKFGLRARARTDVTADTIKEELAAGNPVIIPAAGRDLGNPYFSGDGPWYHALVIIGYEKRWTGRRYFVTNDPGTKRGKGYEYRDDVLLNAIHDWTGVKEEIRSGGKAMVILEK